MALNIVHYLLNTLICNIKSTYGTELFLQLKIVTEFTPKVNDKNPLLRYLLID